MKNERIIELDVVEASVQQTYNVEIFCSNCCYEGPVDVPKGVLVTALCVRLASVQQSFY